MKAQSTTHELAIWFVRTFLERDFDYRTDKKHLKLAKDLVNPGRDRVTGQKVEPYTVDDIKEALLSLRDGRTAVTDYLPFSEWMDRRGRPGRINSLGILFWQHEGETFIQALLRVPDPPAVYEFQEFAEWVKQHGVRGLKQGKWDGLFQWRSAENPETCVRLSYEELAEIVGDALAEESMALWLEARDDIPKRMPQGRK